MIDDVRVDAHTNERGGARKATHLTPASTIVELLATHPVAARVLIDRRMHCVGCDIAPFETIGDACALYGVAVDDFFADINRALASGGRTNGDGISDAR